MRSTARSISAVGGDVERQIEKEVCLGDFTEVQEWMWEHVSPVVGDLRTLQNIGGAGVRNAAFEMLYGQDEFGIMVARILGAGGMAKADGIQDRLEARSETKRGTGEAPVEKGGAGRATESRNERDAATDQQWVSMTRTWLLNEKRRVHVRYRGIAAIGPGEKKKPFRATPNPFEGYFIPGRRFNPDPAHQEDLRSAHAAHQAEWDSIRGTKEQSDAIFSVPAIVIYTSRLRDTGSLVLANFYCIRGRHENGEGYEDHGVIIQQTLLRRVCPEYTRRYADDTPYAYRDKRGLERQLKKLAELKVIRWREAEYLGKPAYEFWFLEGWQDRLGPMPTMPAPNRIRIARLRREARRRSEQA